MAERFNLTAQLQLQAPTNTSQVVGNIRKQLSGITANVQVKGDTRNLAKINSQLQSTSRSAASASAGVGTLNRNLSEAARRFSVITVATGTMLAFARTMKNAVGEAIAFERELVRISQVTGKTLKELRGLSKEVTRLSTTWGVQASEILGVSKVLAQAGFDAKKTKGALDILAKTNLGATFENLKDTTEGAIAVLRQFRTEARAAGGDVKFLEQTMDAINSVSKSFAVESGDLITAIRRVGGVFEAAGGKVNELIALFTSVRATTRESAETIATGLRTIFTRIQRTDTIDQLKQLGIELHDSQGKFVGAYEAVRRLSAGLSSLDPRDFRFSEIVESLGGFRQIGKVIPLIRQFTLAQDALNVAQASSGSVTRDAVIAQQALAVQAEKVSQQFGSLMRKFADSGTFKSIAKFSLQLATAFIKVAEALEPLLPMITALVGMKIGQALAPGIGALMMGRRGKASGGMVHGFARGGTVPGTGNRDTVPAILQPGEFVIKKSSAKKLGSNTLEAMNANRFQAGGKNVKPKTNIEKLKAGATVGLAPGELGFIKSALIKRAGDKDGDPELDIGGAFLQPQGLVKNLRAEVKGAEILKKMIKVAGGGTQAEALRGLKNSKGASSALNVPINITSGSFSDRESARFRSGIQSSLTKHSSSFASSIGMPFKGGKFRQAFQTSNREQIEGGIFESFINGVSNKPFDNAKINPNDTFDFAEGMGSAASMFGLPGGLISDAKRTFSTSALASLTKKGATKIAQSAGADLARRLVPRKRKAHGGKIDSVPALLTPGEFVINKSSAQSIGYSNLSKMNQRGVQGFNTGGTVGWKRFANGGPTGKGMGLRADSMGTEFGAGIKDLMNVEKALQSIGVTAGRTAEEGTRYAQVMANVKSELEGGASEAEAFDKVFAKIKTTSADNKKAVEAEAAAKEKVRKAPHSGDAAAGDVQRYGGLVGGKDSAAAVAATGTPGAKATIEAQENLARQMDIEAAGIAKQIKANEKGVGSQEALTRARRIVRDGYTETVAKIDKTRKAIAEANEARGKYKRAILKAAKDAVSFKGTRAVASKIGGGVAAVGGKMAGVVGGRAGMQAGAQSMNAVAGAAQQFAFAGMMVTSLAINMGGLNEQTKQAITEVGGFVTAIIGLGGTFVQMFTSMIGASAANTTAEIQGTVAAGMAAKGDIDKTVAAKAAALADKQKAGRSMAMGFMGVAAAAIALMAVFKWFAATAGAAADAQKKVNDKMMSDFESGKGSGAGLVGGTMAEVKSRGEESAANTAMWAAGGSAVGAGLAGMALGAAVGTAIPIPVIGTVVGALVGLGVGLVTYNSQLEAAAEKQKQAAEVIEGQINSYIATTKSINQFKDTLTDIDLEKSLTPEARVAKRISAGQEMDVGAGEVGTSLKVLGDLAKEAGKPIAQLSEADFEGNAAALAKFNFATKNAEKTVEGLGLKAKEAHKTLAEAAAIELTGEKSFDEVMAANGQFAQALRASIAAIQEEAAIKAQIIDAEVKSMRDAADTAYKLAGNDAGAHKAWVQAREAATLKEKEATNIRQRANEQSKATVRDQQAVAAAANERVNADKRAAAAAEALRLALLQTKEFMMGLAAIESNFDVRDRSREQMMARQSGESMNFQALSVKGLDDISMVRDVEKFKSDLKAVVSNLPPAMQKEGRRMIDTVVKTNEVFSEGKERVLAQFKGKHEKLGEEQQKDIIRAAGLDPDKMDDRIVKEIMANIVKAAGDVGGIEASEFEEIFSPIKEQGELAAQGLKKIEELRSRDIDSYAKYLDHVEQQRDKQIESEKRVRETQNKGRELRAAARGQQLSMGAMDAGRTQVAQAGLRGTGVRAGDIRGARKAQRAARIRLKQIEKEIGLASTNDQRKGELMKEEKKHLRVIKQVTEELERLGDQSEKAAEIMEQIDEEKAKRETLTGIVTDFVVGGQDTRQQMLTAGAGARQAIATGTLQNQTAEQRGLTVGLLDRLEDIFIGGTGMTGKQIKQELVFRDAIRMGMDPAMAEMLATATSKEEKLIESLDKLTGVMDLAVKAMDEDVAEQNKFATGGLVQYRAGGGSIFRPKGTDTVPAMLTPGEFVVRKSAVDKIGVNNLSALNKGAGGAVQYRAGGGRILQSGGYENIARTSLLSQPNWGSFIRLLKDDHIHKSHPGGFANMLREWSRGTFNPYSMDLGSIVHTLYDDFNSAVTGMVEVANPMQLLLKQPDTRTRIPFNADPVPVKTAFIKRVEDLLTRRMSRVSDLNSVTNQGRWAMLPFSKSGKGNRAPGAAANIKPKPRKMWGQLDVAGSYGDIVGAALFADLAGWDAGLVIQDVAEYAGRPYWRTLKKDRDELKKGFDQGNFDRAKEITRRRKAGGKPAYSVHGRQSPGPSHYKKMGGLVDNSAKNRAMSNLIQFYKEQRQAEPGGGDISTAKTYRMYKNMLGVGTLDRDSDAAMRRNYEETIEPLFLQGLDWASRPVSKQLDIAEGRMMMGLPAAPKGVMNLPQTWADQPAPLKTPTRMDVYTKAKNQQGAKYSKKDILIMGIKQNKAGEWWARYINQDGTMDTLRMSTLDDVSQQQIKQQPAWKEKVPYGDPISIGRNTTQIPIGNNRWSGWQDFKNPIYKDKVYSVLGALMSKNYDYLGINDSIYPQPSFIPAWTGFGGLGENFGGVIPNQLMKHSKDPASQWIPWQKVIDDPLAKTAESKFVGQHSNIADVKSGANRFHQQQFRLREQQRGDTRNFAVGGGVSGVDSVPAMLTPGEFVMSPEAVTRHGVGYMKQLNKGRVPGFRRGGLIGSGNVQYKANGGSAGNGSGVISMDPAAMGQVLETFVSDFSTELDKLVKPFTNMSDSLANLASAFSNMTMYHSFEGGIELNVNISNKDAIIAAVSDGITPTVITLVQDLLKQSLNEFRSG